MAPRRRNEEPSISFHFMERVRHVGGGNHDQIPFAEEEYQNVYEHLVKCKTLDLQNNAVVARLQTKNLVPVLKCSRSNRVISGTYEAIYTGHEFKNSARGRIPHDSLNHRPFVFILYLSKKGRIYIGSQYLGGYGGYTGLKSTILDALADENEIITRSFNASKQLMNDAEAIEVEIGYTRASKSDLQRPELGARRTVAFRREKGDEMFSDEVKSKFLRHANKPKNEIREIVKQAVANEEIQHVDDTVIETCDVIAKIGNKQTTIQLLDSRDYATKFPLDVKMNFNGHPDYEETIKSARELLRDVILKYNEPPK